MENYYKILGLKLGATLDEVEEKHSELLKEFDPNKQPDELKEFFTVECNKVKEAYKEISLSLINSDSVEQVVDEINSDASEIDSENEDLVTSPIEELIDESQENKGSKFSISSEVELKLTRAYLIMFILGLPLAFIIAGGESDLQELIEVYFEVPLLALMYHFIGAILVLICHMILIIRISGFLSIRENLAAYFIERKKYFIRILVFTPLVLFSLYGWSGMINYSEYNDYWYNSYQEIKSVVSGEDYDSGCDKEIRLKLHNHTYQTLRFYVSYKLRNGEWSSWVYWSIDSREYTGGGLGDGDGGTVYASDYRYFITTTDDKKYMHSRDVPHITNTCNAKCINIY